MTMCEPPSNDAVFVIAEAGVNHNGDTARAIAMVDAAADAGADAVKFQTFRAERLALPSAPQAAYQARSDTKVRSQLDMLRELELSPEAHFVLRDHCRDRGIEFMSTPFDVDCLHFLVRDVGVRKLKISSGEASNAQLLLEAARSGVDRIFMSTGMARLEDVREACAVMAFGLAGSGTPSRRAFAAALDGEDGRRALAGTLTLLHCTTAYPAPLAEVNLRAMETLRRAFGTQVGYSDHTTGLLASVAAAAMGASVVEKHFTLDRSLPGPDHAASLEPLELAAMIRDIRGVSSAFGTGEKSPTASELENMTAARKSLVATQPIRKGEPFTEENLTAMRPGTGRSAMLYWDTVGTQADRDYAAGDLIVP